MKNLGYRIFALLSFSFLVSAASLNAQGVADPASLDVYSTSATITLDGKLDEAVWSMPAPYLLFQKSGVPSGNANTPTTGLVVKPVYWDSSATQVKFLHNGLDLYVALSSNDKQVCRFDWEGDGMFMVLKNAANNNLEFKLYVMSTNSGSTWQFGLETNAPAGSAVGLGVVDGTIYDSTDVDKGYTAELVIHLDQLGYTTAPSALPVNINIFDPDNYSKNVGPWTANGNYYKQWWGSEWASSMRALNLVAANVPVELTSFKASVNGKNVNLSWSTSTEVNNKGFEIQKSTDSKNFTTVAFIEGKGTTSKTQNYSYSDKSGNAEKYYYRLKQIDMSGAFSYSSVVETKGYLPEAFGLNQNYPNPFNPSTTINFELPVDAKVILNVYNMLGQRVASVVESDFSAGSHNVNFNAAGLSSGLYIYSMTAIGVDGSKFTSNHKMTLMK